MNFNGYRYGKYGIQQPVTYSRTYVRHDMTTVSYIIIFCSIISQIDLLWRRQRRCICMLRSLDRSAKAIRWHHWSISGLSTRSPGLWNVFLFFVYYIPVGSMIIHTNICVCMSVLVRLCFIDCKCFSLCLDSCRAYRPWRQGVVGRLPKNWHQRLDLAGLDRLFGWWWKCIQSWLEHASIAI